MKLGDKILVTGGTGFLGSYILRYLLKCGYQNVFAIRRPTSNLSLVTEVVDELQWIEAGILDYSILKEIVEEVDYIIHSAAVISFTKKEFAWMMKVNVEGTKHLLDLALENGIKKFIQISSISSLGREKDGQTLDEKSPWVRSKYTTQYAISKYMSEMECYRAAAEGLDVAILNPSVILGGGLWKSGSTNIIKKVGEGLSFYTRGATGIVDVRDVAILTIKLMESNITNDRIIANAYNLSFKELMTSLAKEFGHAPPNRELSPFLGGLAWRLEYFKSILKRDSPIITKETMRQTNASFYYKNDKSRELLNHQYLPLEKTLKESVQAYKHFAQSGEIVTLDF